MTTETIMSINLAPDVSVYSPHVRTIKQFLEGIATETQRITALPPDADGFGHIEEHTEFFHTVSAALPAVLRAMSDVLSDDFMLIVDDKRRPGLARADWRNV